MSLWEPIAASKATTKATFTIGLGLIKPPFLLFLLPMIITTNLEHVH